VVDAAGLSSGRRDIRFLLVGDGNQRAAVAAHAASVPNVEVLPPVDSDDYPLLLAAADVLLVSEQPGTGEMSLPSKLTSYLAAGRPVLAAVSSDGACAKELARTHGAGHVVAPGDPARLLEALLHLKAHHELRDRMSVAATTYARGNLTRSAAAALVAEFLLRLRTGGDARGSVRVPRQERRRPRPTAVAYAAAGRSVESSDIAR
jgi:colanic acid biosynthesis glycosyl transferase WcaI